MIKTTYKTEIKNILQPLDPNLCLNLLTPPRLSYRATPTLLQGNPTLLQGDLGSPRGHHRVGLKQRQRLVRLSNIWQITEYLADYQIFCRLPNILQITEDSADYRIFARLPNICQITKYSPNILPNICLCLSPKLRTPFEISWTYIQFQHSEFL